MAVSAVASGAVSGEELRALEQLFRSSEARVIMAYRTIKCSHSTSERERRRPPQVRAECRASMRAAHCSLLTARLHARPAGR